MRQIVLDTETTGVGTGHRIIEVGCLELVDRRQTGRVLQYYLNPQRAIDEGAMRVHGITDEFLRDKPLFREVAESLAKFLEGAELIIHNAPFDLGFLKYEYNLLPEKIFDIEAQCTILDTLPLARKLHPGQRNSLDALCKRYNVDLSKRDYHGALLDAELLARVYLTMTQGQASFLGALEEVQEVRPAAGDEASQSLQNKSALVALTASPEEKADHLEYLKLLHKSSKTTRDFEELIW